jgi:hypothetical protein
MLELNELELKKRIKEKMFNQLFNQSLVSEENEDWLNILVSEYVDDNEGLSKEEFFKSHWQRFFPLDIDFMKEEDFNDFEKFLLNYF